MTLNVARRVLRAPRIERVSRGSSPGELLSSNALRGGQGGA